MFFKKNAKPTRKGKSPEQLMAEGLPNRKKVQYDPVSIPAINGILQNDVSGLLGFTPINYYKNKLKFIQGVFYFDEEYKEIFVCFEEYVNDRLKSRSEFFKVDYGLFKSALRKFGQNI